MNYLDCKCPGVYKIQIGEQCYIGSSANVYLRIKVHFSNAKARREPRLLQSAFDSGLPVNVSVLQLLSPDNTKWDLLQAEQHCINTLHPVLNAKYPVLYASPFAMIDTFNMIAEYADRNSKDATCDYFRDLYARNAASSRRAAEECKQRYLTRIGG